MRIKICGITKAEQAREITQLGVATLGFICVPSSPRFISIDQILTIVKQLPEKTEKIGVFANTTVNHIYQTVIDSELTGVQLHGDESPEFCENVRQLLPQTEIIKALRVKNLDTLIQSEIYFDSVDTLLFDAYHPDKLGGTGKTIDWQILQQFNPRLPWFLSGGLTPDNIRIALQNFMPNFTSIKLPPNNINSDNLIANNCIGIDISSGVERAPGDKDLTKIRQLLDNISAYRQSQ